MEEPDYQAFLEVIPRFTLDKTTNDFVNFAQEKLGKIQGALTPTACLLLCGMHGRGQGSNIPEFKLIADRLTGFTESSLFKEVSGRLAPLRSNAAVMTSKMVAVIEAAERIASETKSADSKIYPRHLVGSVLRYLLKTASADERQSLNEIGIDHKPLIETFLTVVIEEQKYPDAPQVWGRFLEPFGKTVTAKVSDSAGLGVSASDRVENSAETVANAREAFEELLKKHQWSQSLHSLLGGMGSALNSRWEGGLRACLTPEALMLALLQFGKEHADDPNYVVTELAKLVALGPKDLRARFEAELDKSANFPDNQRTTSVVEARLSEVIATAEALAQKLSRDRIISIRHLTAALLLPPKGSTEAGSYCKLPGDVFPVKEFVPVLIDHVRKNVQDRSVDVDGGWDETVSLLSNALKAGEKDWLVTLAADADEGMDRLGIMPDVRALACVLSSRSLTPPLCVGLFGDWGTGKTFFIKKTHERVRWLTQKSRQAVKSERETSFCTSIAQITFNAWHYVDSNLWASIACRIFEGLDEFLDNQDQTAIETSGQKEQLFKKLESSKAKLQEAKAQAADAKQQKEAAEKQLQELQEQRQKKTLELGQIRDAAIKAADRKNPTIRKNLEDAASEIGLSKLSENLTQLDSTLDQLHTAGGRLRALCLALFYGKDKWWRLGLLVFLLVLVPGAGLLVRFGLEYFRSSGLAAHAAEVIAQIGTFIAVVTEWLRRNLNWAKTVVDKVESARKGVDTILADARAQAGPEEARLAKELLVLADRETAARKTLNEAEANVEEAEKAQKELEERANGKLVAEFIRQKVRGGTYQTQLGIISSIRKDLESMSKLLKEAKGLREREFKTERNAAKELAKLPKIDRIILYIDDLDRCPEKTVVEVLQAVHLLLAFPLFIVVIGVDCRWLLQSLKCQYAALGGQKDENARSLSGSIASFASTPQNYLEKIIQVPFNLPPMGGEGFKHLLADILPCEALKPTAGSAIEHKERHTAEDESAGQQADKTELLETPTAVTPPGQPTRSGEEAAPQEEADVDMAPEVLKITPKELEFIGKLVSLVSTPRSAKRLGNVYRLLRAAIPQGDLPRFLDDTGSSAEFPTAMTMLAIQAGFPVLAREVFTAILEGSRTWQEVQDALTARIVPADQGNQNGAWNAIERGYSEKECKRFCEILRALLKGGVISELPESATDWVHKICRYSFLPVDSRVATF